MKIIFKFEAFSPDPEDSYKQTVYVEAESRVLARDHLEGLGFFDIEDCGHTPVYVMSYKDWVPSEQKRKIEVDFHQ